MDLASDRDQDDVAVVVQPFLVDIGSVDLGMVLDRAEHMVDSFEEAYSLVEHNFVDSWLAGVAAFAADVVANVQHGKFS